MVSRRPTRMAQIARTILLIAIVATVPACVGVNEGGRGLAWDAKGEKPIQLPGAEQLIDDLDRIMTAYGTISVKTPDVWGQDRLSKFRSEYEAEMAAWLKVGFKGDINASVRRSETESTQVQLGGDLVRASAKAATVQTPNDDATLASLSKVRTGLDATLPASQATPDKTPVSLEPTVVLDEHSNYLNHLNQLRRVNAGDDLADRPGYGLYLIRIPVTLSPGPRSRRGKGAIITVSAKPVMTKHTLHNALRNVVINDSVNNLTHAICNQSIGTGDRVPGQSVGTFSLVSYADTELFCGRTNIELIRGEAEHQLAREIGDAPHHRVARVTEWLRAELEASYPSFVQSVTPGKSDGPAPAPDPLEELGTQVAARDFDRIARLRDDSIADPQVKQASGTSSMAADDLGARRKRVVSMLAFAMRIQAAGISRRLKQDMIDQEPTLKEKLSELSFFEPEVSDEAFAAFEHYVNTKWPLRVYAIEPVIAQQNVADVFGRRKQAAFDLVGSAPAGLSRALSAVAAERRAADDEAAIRLNPTMVGFGAGQSTFGWVFYPRLQSSKGRDGRFWTDLALLANGRLPDPTGNDQSIEPGQRECTALIEMPNFVPKIEFITVADWFRTSEAGDGQKADLEKASVLSRKLVAATAALNRARRRGRVPPRGIPDRHRATQAARRHDAHPAPDRPRPLQRRPERCADLLLAGLAAPPLFTGLAGQASRTRRGGDALRRREELQRPRHSRGRRGQDRQVRAHQPQPAPGHDPERRLPDAERRRHSSHGHQRRHAQRRLEPPPDQHGPPRPADTRERRQAEEAGEIRVPPEQASPRPATCPQTALADPLRHRT